MKPAIPGGDVAAFPDLYKFTSLKGERPDWFEGMVVRGEFYFAFPDELNDPFEFRPRFVAPEGHPELLKFKLRAQLRKLGHRWKGTKREPHRSVAETARLMTELWRSPDGGRRNQIQLFCMSTVRSHPLLWAHYADGHRGACVHLDMRHMPFKAAVKVDYSLEYPKIPVVDQPSVDEIFRRMIRVKALEWSYEGEYRVVRHLRDPIAAHDVGWKGQVAVTDPNAACGITLGAEISKEAERAVLAMVRKRMNPIPIWKARPNDERFAFDFERVA